MPMIVEACFAMLACARIGAIHSVVFGGFAAKELSQRIDHVTPKLLITTSYGLEPGKQIPYLPIVEDALALCKFEGAQRIPRLIKQRSGLETKVPKSNYYDYDALMVKEKQIAAAVGVESSHPLYVLYTSGTTGAPKGIVRDQGGTCVALSFAFKNIYDIQKGQTIQAMSDIGWVVGHTCTVYGPLLVGAQSVVYEGKPITPNAGKIWELAERYKTKNMFVAPTAVRILKKLDFEGSFIKKYDLKSLEIMTIAGERCDPATITWLHQHLPSALLVD